MAAIDSDELDEVLRVLHHSRTLLDELVVRGLRACGPAEQRRLDALCEELSRVGARHLAERLGALSQALRGDDPGAPFELLSAQTSLYLFDRILTLRVAEAGLAAIVEADALAGRTGA